MWTYRTDNGDIAVACDGKTEEKALETVNQYTDNSGIVHNGEATTLYELSDDAGYLAIGYFTKARK